jgi:ABC-type nickel/cobalt efflux system permease component RcnA
MTSFTDPLNTQDPSCCHRKAGRTTRTSLEISLLENGLYALYALVMLGTFSILNNTNGIYVCVGLLVVILTNMYMINRAIKEDQYEGHDNDLDTSAETESDHESEAEVDSEVENASSILEEFKRVVNETNDEYSDQMQNIIGSSSHAADEYERLSREYDNIERIIQNIAAEYRQKAIDAREAAEASRAEESEAEARADAADEREHNED